MQLEVISHVSLIKKNRNLQLPAHTRPFLKYYEWDWPQMDKSDSTMGLNFLDPIKRLVFAHVILIKKKSKIKANRHPCLKYFSQIKMNRKSQLPVHTRPSPKYLGETDCRVITVTPPWDCSC